MSSTPQFTTGQLRAARDKAWHQAGEPLLTLEAAREWIDNAGLLLFSPQPQLAPAPSFLEATLGEATEAPSMAQAATARSLVARLVSEGNALPLNLLGGPGEAPDFVVSAQMFSFVFTLRGDKLWKQAPATTGAVKVSPLSLAVHELLAERGAMTAAELASELGREVTEAAILRSLNELWTHLRVIPLMGQGEAATMWELTSRRFTKAIKAGVNAGQPTALSALVSLYLNQSLLATEDDVAAFLSPLAPRSRIREVVHALTAGRQLEAVVLEGKTLLHIPGTLPEFPETEVPAAAGGEEPATAEGGETQPAEEGRIQRFKRTGERPARGDFKGKPARSFAAGGARSSRPSSDRGERERRPFRRDAATGGAATGESAKPGFTKPWDEDRKPRPAVGEEGPAKRPYVRKERPTAGSFAKRAGSSDRSDRSERSERGTARRSFGDKPAFRKDRGEGFAAKPSFAKGGERKPFVRREGADASGTGASDGAARPRRPFSDGGGERKPRFDRADSKAGGFAAKRPYVRRDSGDAGGDAGRDARPPRRTFDSGDRKPGSAGAKRPYVRRDSGEAAGGESRPPRRTFGGGDERRPGGSAPKRPYVRRDSGDGSESRPPRRTFGDGGERNPGGSGAKRPYVRRDSSDAAGGESRPPRRTLGGGGERKPGGFPPKRPYARRESGDASGEGRSQRPSFGANGAKRSFGDRPAGRPARGAGAGSEPRAGARPGTRPSAKFGARPGARSGGGDRPAGLSRSSFGSKPAGAGSRDRPGGKVPFGGKPGFGKRPAGPGGPRPAGPRAAGPRAAARPKTEE